MNKIFQYEYFGIIFDSHVEYIIHKFLRVLNNTNANETPKTNSLCYYNSFLFAQLSCNW